MAKKRRRKLRRIEGGIWKGRRERGLEREPIGKWRNQLIDQVKPGKGHQEVKGLKGRGMGDTPPQTHRGIEE